MATAIYRAPPGDSKVVEWNGVTFFDGQPVELDSSAPLHAHMLSKMANNPYFELDGEAKPRRGRPPKALSDGVENV